MSESVLRTSETEVCPTCKSSSKPDRKQVPHGGYGANANKIEPCTDYWHRIGAGIPPDGAPSMPVELRASKPKLTLGRLVLETARGSVKERMLTPEEARDIAEQLGRIGEKAKANVRAQFYPSPLRFIEPESDQDVLGPRIVDANGSLVASLYWPAHSVEATEAAEQETYALGRAMAAALDGAADETRAEGRCETYWRIHANRCLRPNKHEGACYYAAPGYAIEIGEQFAFEPPPR